MISPYPLHALAAALFLAVAASAPAAPAQPAPGAQPLPVNTLKEFRPLAANWKMAGGVGGNPQQDKTLTPLEGTGVLVCNPGKDKDTRGNLFTAWEHGDAVLDLEFLLAPGSNSGVYLQGRYEVQLFDSFGKRDVGPSDCGGIYHRWDPARGKGNEGYEGKAPLANACREPGAWQKLHIEFQAPRFDATGQKTRNARIVRAVLNDVVVQQNVDLSGPTRGPYVEGESPQGPIVIQGDHGPVALRHLRVKALAP